MSETVRCPTCGCVAHIKRPRGDSDAEPTLVAVTDEEKTKKIEQLKGGLARMREKLDAAEARIAELEQARA